ncbi:MAG: hypothetical protein GPOALKHO_000891 [Sodalis sp.]|nr:MAG: hypothetical protein GPOALKHO_000891 [Sodalis sp.]
MPVDPPPPLVDNLFAPSAIVLHSGTIVSGMNIATNYFVEGIDAATRCVDIKRRAVTVQTLPPIIGTRRRRAPYFSV